MPGPSRERGHSARREHGVCRLPRAPRGSSSRVRGAGALSPVSQAGVWVWGSAVHRGTAVSPPSPLPVPSQSPHRSSRSPRRRGALSPEVLSSLGFYPQSVTLSTSLPSPLFVHRGVCLPSAQGQLSLNLCLFPSGGSCQQSFFNFSLTVCACDPLGAAAPNTTHVLTAHTFVSAARVSLLSLRFLFLSADSEPPAETLTDLKPNQPNLRLPSLPQSFSNRLAADGSVILTEVPKRTHSGHTPSPHAEQRIWTSARSALRPYPESAISHCPRARMSAPPEGCAWGLCSHPYSLVSLPCGPNATV